MVLVDFWYSGFGSIAGILVFMVLVVKWCW